VKLVPTPEQEELRESLRRFLGDHAPMRRVREVMGSAEGHDPALWRRMADELGLQAMTVPEAYGGAGFGQVELSVVMEELGRALAPGPFLASAVLATSALLALDDEEARHELLPGLASGDRIATLAVVEAGGWDAAAVGMRAGLEGGRWRLSGTKTLVLDGCLADLVLVAARAGDELALFAVEGSAPGLTRTSLKTLDLTRPMARLDFAQVPARRLVSEDGAGALRRVMDLAAVALAGEQLGGLQRCLEMSVEYAGARAQFGRAIGSFQAIKHLCADMQVDMELARSAARWAAWVADEASEELPVAASVAAAHCSEAFFRVAANTIQVHGGIGFTWEHDAHLHFRRAKSSQLLMGTPSQRRAQLASRLGI
jgi:alkylation response protein AidB-like acyl-CoA dehydrogenase